MVSFNQKLMGQEERTLFGRHMVWVEQWKCREVVKLKCSTCEGDVQEKNSLDEIVLDMLHLIILHSHCRTDKPPVLICTGIVIHILLISI